MGILRIRTQHESVDPAWEAIKWSRPNYPYKYVEFRKKFSSNLKVRVVDQRENPRKIFIGTNGQLTLTVEDWKNLVIAMQEAFSTLDE